MSVQPYELRIADATLMDLHARLAAARLPPPDDVGWDAGINPAFLHALIAHWRLSYDWRVHEAELRRLHHFTTELGGTTIHFVHERGKGDAPLPLVLTHGFPDSFVRFTKLIPLLVDPGAHGGDPRDAFDVVVPSLPGFGFSGPPDRGSDVFHIADRWHDLMTELGYGSYAAHGGDWGGLITEWLARRHGGSVIGVHLTDVPFWHAMRPPDERSPAEDAYLAEMKRFQTADGAYAMIQGTRPQTLADALNDSPAGLAAWLVPLFRRLSDCDGDVERRFTKDELITYIMIYWVTGTIGSSFLPYYDILHRGAPRWMLGLASDWIRSKLRGPRAVPAGFALFRSDIHPPREWAERFFRVERWTEMPRGGHFAAHEEPELLAEDIRAFFRPLRARRPGIDFRSG
jgi:pimeloyl-ACP methyl ester carboxylesterase